MRRGFNRLFFILTVCWAVYLLLIYPIQKHRDADKILQSELQKCYHDELRGNDLDDCETWAQATAGTPMWTLKTYYARESWFLVFILVAVPLLVYGFCRVATSATLWVWRGFKAT